jgi:hypothetical protein
VTASQTRIELRERLEESATIFVGDADARIANREAHVVVPTMELEANLSDVGELHRVAREVHEDLPNFVDVARHSNRRIGHGQREGETLLMRQWLDDGCDRLDQISREKIGRANPLATFVETRKGQDFFDDRREMLRHGTHALQHVELILGKRADDLIGQQLAIAGERRQWCAQLVRHRGKKSALGSISRLGLIEQFGFPQCERRVISDDAKPVRLTFRERRGAGVARHDEYSEDDAPRHEWTEQHRSNAKLGRDLGQRPRLRAEIVDSDDVTLANDLASQRTWERKAPTARNGERAHCRNELALVGDGFQDSGAVSSALFGRRGAENFENLLRVGLGRQLAREITKRLAIAQRLVGQADQQSAVEVAPNGDVH